MLCFATVYVLLLMAMTDLARPAWEHIGLVKLIQFPWRLLSCVAIIQLLCIGGVAEFLRRWKLRGWSRALPIIVLAVAIGWYSEAFRIRDDSYMLSRVVHLAHVEFQNIRTTRETYSQEDEFLPRSSALAATAPLGDGPILVASDADIRIEREPPDDQYELTFEVAHAKSCEVVLNQWYFPGWSIVCDGDRIPDAVIRSNLTADGRMRIELSGNGTTRISARYEGPPGGWICFVFAIAIPGLSLLLGRHLTFGGTPESPTCVREVPLEHKPPPHHHRVKDAA
jgi:hypothetical protein